MKCFDVVKLVLDATYEEIPGHEKTRDVSIKKALTDMADQYKNHLMSDGGPNFDDPATRFGYVFAHVAAHGHWIYDLLRNCPEAIEVFNSGKARITCLGGGPGSEMVGTLKVLDELEIECSLFCELIDGCEAWKSTWSDLAYELGHTGSVNTDYVIHDVANKDTWQSPSKIQKADIIILSFFVSEIYHLPTSTEYIKTMLGKAKPGALLLMLDNRTPAVYDLVDALAFSAGFLKLKSKEEHWKIYDSGEDMAKLKKYMGKFDMSAKLTGNIAWRTFRKK